MSTRGNTPAPKTPQAADYADLGKLFVRNDGLNRQLDIFKNGFINGAFDWNQRGQASYVAGPAQAIYSFDRWGIYNMGPNGAASVASQTFGLGDAAPGSDYFIRVGCSGHSAAGDGACLYQAIENVRRFAGKRCVLKGMARRYSGAGNVAASMSQAFGTGGSAGVLKNIGMFTPAAIWQPFAMIVDVPPLTTAQALGSLTGQGTYLNIRLFLSAGSNYNAETGNLGLQTLAVDFAELEFKEIIPGYGDQYPGFERLPREIELLRCQRYFEAGYINFVTGTPGASYYFGGWVGFKVTKRLGPSMTYAQTAGGGVNGSATVDSQTPDGFRAYQAGAGNGNAFFAGNYTAIAEI